MGISNLLWSQEVGKKIIINKTQLQLIDGPIKSGDHYLVAKHWKIIILCCLDVKKGYVWSTCGRYMFHIVDCRKVAII